MTAIINFYCLAAKFDFSASQIIFQSRRCTEYLQPHKKYFIFHISATFDQNVEF